jgi:4-amino-4-deoxy-L-arabinose transferase-like glycosyltransferase
MADAVRPVPPAVPPRALLARTSRFGTHVVLLAGLGLGLRLLYVLFIAPAPVGLDGDWRFYHSAANLIAHGRFYYRGILHHAYATAEHPPLYPLVLSAVAWLGGVGVLAQRVVGCVVGAASVVLFALVGRRLAGERAGLLAALIAAVYPPLIVVDGALMSEPLLVFGLLVTLLLAYRVSAVPTAWRAAVLGAVIGVTTLAHTEALLLVPLLLPPVLWRPAPGRWTRIGVALAACIAVLAPWVARNMLVFHRFTVATNSNTVIAGANCRQTYYGRDIGWWRLDCDARARTFRQLVQGDANIHPALAYARNHLGRLPLVAAVRVLRTFSLFQPLREGNGQIRRRWFDIVGLAIYYPLLLLAALGLRALRQPRWPLIALICLSVVVSVIDSGLPRLRIPADVALILLSAVALASLPSRRGGGGSPRRPTSGTQRASSPTAPRSGPGATPAPRRST